MVLRNTDYIQQLADYIKRNLSKGYTLDALRFALINQGYGRSEIDRAVKLANEQLAMAAPKMVEKPVIKVTTEPPVEVKKSFWQRVKAWFS